MITIIFDFVDGKYTPYVMCAYCGKPIRNATLALIRHDIAQDGNCSNRLPAYVLHKGMCDDLWMKAMDRIGMPGFAELGTTLFDVVHNSFIESEPGARSFFEELSAKREVVDDGSGEA